MYPVPFRIGDFEVTSFGVMVALAALLGLWLFRRELRRSGLPVDATDAGAASPMRLSWGGTSSQLGSCDSASSSCESMSGWPLASVSLTSSRWQRLLSAASCS